MGQLQWLGERDQSQLYQPPRVPGNISSSEPTRVAFVVEGREEMGVLIATKTVEVGHDGIDSSPDHPPLIVSRKHGPAQRSMACFPPNPG